MKKLIYLLPLLFIFISCTKQPVHEISKEPVKQKYYTVIFQGIKYENLRKCYGSDGGFYMKTGRYICFQGNYLYYEQLDGDENERNY